jgi:hypothetical protein
VRQWPTPGDEAYDRLLAVLHERIASEADERTRSRLQKLRDAVADVRKQPAG